jgi:hypothetical protein
MSTLIPCDTKPCIHMQLLHMKPWNPSVADRLIRDMGGKLNELDRCPQTLQFGFGSTNPTVQWCAAPFREFSVWCGVLQPYDSRVRPEDRPMFNLLESGYDGFQLTLKQLQYTLRCAVAVADLPMAVFMNELVRRFRPYIYGLPPWRNTLERLFFPELLTYDGVYPSDSSFFFCRWVETLYQLNHCIGDNFSMCLQTHQLGTPDRYQLSDSVVLEKTNPPFYRLMGDNPSIIRMIHPSLYNRLRTKMFSVLGIQAKLQHLYIYHATEFGSPAGQACTLWMIPDLVDLISDYVEATSPCALACAADVIQALGTVMEEEDRAYKRRKV